MIHGPDDRARHAVGTAISRRRPWYFRFARSWHAREPYRNERMWLGSCGRVWGLDQRHPAPDEADRLPTDAHVCGDCARVIAARTADTEKPPSLTTQAASRGGVHVNTSRRRSTTREMPSSWTPPAGRSIATVAPRVKVSA